MLKELSDVNMWLGALKKSFILKGAHFAESIFDETLTPASSVGLYDALLKISIDENDESSVLRLLNEDLVLLPGFYLAMEGVSFSAVLNEIDEKSYWSKLEIGIYTSTWVKSRQIAYHYTYLEYCLLMNFRRTALLFLSFMIVNTGNVQQKLPKNKRMTILAINLIAGGVSMVSGAIGSLISMGTGAYEYGATMQRLGEMSSAMGSFGSVKAIEKMVLELSRRIMQVYVSQIRSLDVENLKFFPTHPSIQICLRQILRWMLKYCLLINLKRPSIYSMPIEISYQNWR